MSSFFIDVKLKKGQKPCVKFLILFNLKIFAVQLTFVTQRIVFELYTFVISLFFKLLNMIRIFFIYLYQFFEFKY